MSGAPSAVVESAADVDVLATDLDPVASEVLAAGPEATDFAVDVLAGVTAVEESVPARSHFSKCSQALAAEIACLHRFRAGIRGFHRCSSGGGRCFRDGDRWRRAGCRRIRG